MINLANPKAQYLSNKKLIDNSIKKVLANGNYILGEQVKLFEEEFAKYNGVNYAIGVGSGTEALHIALKANGIGEGDEVITTAHTAVATASAIVLSGAKPIFIDVNSTTMNIEPKLIESAINSTTKAIIPVHIYGQPCEMDDISEIARIYDLKIIEDCSQAHGATYNRSRVGTLGNVGCFSFYPTKNLGAIGDGGAIVTNDKVLDRKIRLLRQYGWNKRYISSDEGWNSRLDELQAAILRIKLRTLDEDNALRAKHAIKYNESFNNLPIELPMFSNNKNHVYHLYVIRSEIRDEIKKFLQNEKIITAVQYPVPVHKQKYYRRIVGPISLPITEKLAKRILSLPMYPELPINDQKEVICSLKNFFKKIN